jgi:hypothetical protein
MRRTEIRTAYDSSNFGAGRFDTRQLAKSFLVESVVYRSFGSSTTSYETLTLASIEQLSSWLLRALTVAKRCYSITSSQGGAGKAILKYPARPQVIYLLSCLIRISPSPANDTASSPRFSCGQTKATTLYDPLVYQTSHIKQNGFPPWKTERSQAAHTSIARSLRHSHTFDTNPYFFAFSADYLPTTSRCASCLFLDLQQGRSSDFCSNLELPLHISPIACASRWTD